MDYGSSEKRAKRLPEQTAVLTVGADSEASEPRGGKFASLLDRMGFEIDYGEKDRERTPVKQLPGRAWNGMKGFAHNTRSVFLNKKMAYDKPLFVLVIVLVVVGFVMMSSASYAYAYSHKNNSMYFIYRQLVFIVLGVLAMLLMSTISPEKMKGKTSYILWFVSLLMLVAVLFMDKKNGVHRWLGIGPFSFQPSEIAKFTAILVCSTYIAYHYKEINVMTYGSRERKQKAYRSKKYRFFYSIHRSFITGVWPFLWRVLPILVLLILEPHLSCTIIILLIVGTLMLLGGTRREYFIALLVLAAIGIYLIVFLGVVPYGRARVEMWLDPFADIQGDGWQTVQSLYAISSGGIFGAGFGNSRQKFMYIAEPQNDFIFAVVCEEVGLVGAIVIILIFVAFVWRGFALSIANPDRFSRFVGIGITSQIGYQMLLNVAVVTNLVPNTGISLPFFSYGGTSITMLLAEIGVLLAISRDSTNKVM